jgi:hypothetical protein
VAEIESENDDNINSKDELGNAFAALLVGIIKGKRTKEEKEYSDSYFTLIKGFFLIKLLAISYIIPYIKTLANNFNN